MKESKTLIISPSGNFYGSEQVLFDFLTETENRYTVFVPAKGRFIEKLLLQKKHLVYSFNNVGRLYLRCLWFLVLNKFDSIYINEAGHIKYIKLLARLLKRKRFFVHVRINEDTDDSRVEGIGSNITLIFISNYLAGLVRKDIADRSVVVYDPYILHNSAGSISSMERRRERDICIIGRVTTTKGLDNIESFCNFLESLGRPPIQINFWGDVEKEKHEVAAFVEKSKRYKHVNIVFHGFSNDKENIYKHCSAVVHFSRVEPLGRIFFEALDYKVPFIGFNDGGIGEIARELGISDYMVDYTDNWPSDMYNKLVELPTTTNLYDAARKKMSSSFSASTYSRKIEDLFRLSNIIA